MRGLLRAFTLEGLNLERLLRQAGEKEIRLIGLRRIGGRKVSGCVEERELPALTSLAESGGWRLTLGGPRGFLRATAWLRRHWLVCVLCLMALACAAYASTMMWRVELVDAGTYEADLRAFLAEEGIHPVCRKASVDVPALRDALEWRYPRIAWVECGWRGVTLRIRLVEGVQSDEPLAWDGSADVIAARDGVVASVVTMAGTACVKVGQVVRAGDVLIRGEERGEKGETHPVAARGTVLARVWDGTSVRMPIQSMETSYTGRTADTWQVMTPWFSLWPEEEASFAQEDTARTSLPLGGLFLPLRVVHTTHMEAEWTPSAFDLAQLQQEAGKAALLKLREKIGFREDLIDKWVDYSMIDTGEILATAIGERVIDIALREER